MAKQMKFSISTIKEVSEFNGSAWSTQSDSETAQEIIQFEGKSFMDAIKLDQILNAEQYAIISHAEAVLGYDGLCELAKNSPNGKVSGLSLNRILCGDSVEDLILTPIDDEWELEEISRAIKAIRKNRLKKAEKYTSVIIPIIRERLRDVEGSNFIPFMKWLHKELGLVVSHYDFDDKLAEAEFNDTTNLPSPKHLAAFWAVLEAIENKVYADVQFIDTDEEKLISSIPYLGLLNAYAKKKSSISSCDMFKDDDSSDEDYQHSFHENFWFSPISAYNSCVVVARGSSSYYHCSD